jgi:D-glycero-D-manno-heptose 1,7-bisphosphate phosphatase
MSVSPEGGVGGAGLRQCVVLAGGRDTLRTCGDRPLLAWLLRELQRYGIEEAVLLAGDQAAALRAAGPGLQARLPREMRLRIAEAAPSAGTGGALHQVRDLLDPHFLLCHGTRWLGTNLAPLLAPLAADDGSGRLPRHGDADAGIAVLDRRMVDHLQPGSAPERDVLAASGALPAQDALPARLRRRALFLDRDGVINVDHGYVGSIERFQFVAGAREAIARATRAGWHVFIVTNQSGVARGFYDETAVQTLHRWVRAQVQEAGGTIDDVAYCPHHPEAVVAAYRRRCDCRKPAPGMLLDLLRRWEVDPAGCVMVGDQPTDLQAAAAAGVVGARFHGGNLDDFVAPLLDLPVRSPNEAPA